ncbi:UPF0488 protein CG14286 [Drosophila grimshawi]|uniref:GH12881 n=1 Tax=Drosophila grimshawi TaxID=7222 RepID=B4JLK5_DROGR|nr:UPF0488 protein CG14286 [Drosophila grimshawi]EDW00458.1 GH12881 [Drosophila grimshawi]
MHRRKTAKSVSNPPPIESVPKKPAFDGESDIQFELELYWCVHQLQTALNTGKLSQKIAENAAKNLKTLTSQTAPLIKKRQVMKIALGDYRSKMQQEEKKLLLASKQIKFTPATDANKESRFVKKSALLTSGKDFRFDFAVPTDNATDSDVTPSIAQPATSAVCESEVSSLTTSRLTNDGTQFKFNFAIDNAPDDINFKDLAIAQTIVK